MAGCGPCCHSCRDGADAGDRVRLRREGQAVTVHPSAT
jgi:hypothetical protein